MTLFGLLLALLLLALFYWGVNTAPFIIGQMRTILSWVVIAVAIVLVVIFVLQFLGVDTNIRHLNISALLLLYRPRQWLSQSWQT